ncbi:hypothetical protein [Erwinia sp.]|uniref:hypothetical protein n=1 Tax=Erwinia citreus TaxID=558 RepID=UPI002899FE6D|nr:hypothetical protein [Erwinia sp.]
MIDKYNFLSLFRFWRYRKKGYLDIYQEHQQVSTQIITMLGRINDRTKAHREKAGITHSEQKRVLEDDAVKVALRAAQKLRK